MFQHLGLKDGMMFMQCKVEDGTCYVYDLGFRLTGYLEYKILERVCGYNPLEMMICHALTGKMGFESIADKAIPEFKTPAFNVSCLCAPGTIKEIKGVEEVKSFKEVEDVVIARAMVGDPILNPIEQKPYNGHWAEIILHADKDGVFDHLEISKDLSAEIVFEDLWVMKGDKVEDFEGANNAIDTLVLNFNSAEELEKAITSQRDWLKVVVK